MGGTRQKVCFFDGAGGKGAAELNHGTRNEHKQERDRIAGDEPGKSEEDESRINEARVGVTESHLLEVAVVAYNPGVEKQQHQFSTPTVQWERFLPLRTIKVLLVENDDSTRQVVSALLRNCCYDVTAVANVLEAWRVLEDLTNHIDLVLSEVVMPCFSGVGLLCKIMSHKTCKTIPVIMMSSNDSMGIVFKCLSKGAVDFLVKPIRKNELKNLWQHVWRRCHSSSGSGSESGIQGQNLTKSKSEDDSDHATNSNDEGNGSIGWYARDRSDSGSGTQSSWTKCAIEVNSPQSISPSEQLAGPHYTTCARVIHPRPESFFNQKIPLNTCMDCKEQKKFAADVMRKDLEIVGGLRNTDLRDESNQTDKISTKLTGPSVDKSPVNGQNVSDVVPHVNYHALHEPSAQVADQLGDIYNNTNQQLVLGPPDTASKSSFKITENKNNGDMEIPSLELSLKRLRSTREVGTPSSDDRYVFKRSYMSAFSRYPTSINSVQALTGCGESSLLDISSGATSLNQVSNGISDNHDMSSSNKKFVTKPGLYKEVSTSAIKCSHPISAFHHLQPQNSTIQPEVPQMIDEEATASVVGQSRELQKQVQLQHNLHYYHSHHHVHSLQSQDKDDSSLEKLKATVAFCSSSHGATKLADKNASNYSLNGSNSDSNPGSDGQNGYSTTINLGGTNMAMESTTCLAEKGGVGGGDGSECGSGVGQNRFAMREAALNKFRQKRKERNFSKKVRYQSRQRLAEQRPRFHGQFVRQIIRNENHEANS